MREDILTIKEVGSDMDVDTGIFSKRFFGDTTQVAGEVRADPVRDKLAVGGDVELIPLNRHPGVTEPHVVLVFPDSLGKFPGNGL